MGSVDAQLDLRRLRDFREHRCGWKHLLVDAKYIVCSIVFSKFRRRVGSDVVYDADCWRLAGNGAIWRGDAGVSGSVVDCLAIVLTVFQRQRLAGFIRQSVGVLQTR